MAENINYSRIMRTLDAWASEGGEPREDPGLAGDDLVIAEYCGSVYHDPLDGLYYLKSRELVGPLLGGDVRRHRRIASDLAETMRKNSEDPKRIERTCIVFGIDPEAVPEFQQMVMRKLGPALVEIDNWAMDHYQEDGVRVGVSLFQFDGLD